MVEALSERIEAATHWPCDLHVQGSGSQTQPPHPPTPEQITSDRRVMMAPWSQCDHSTGEQI